MCRVKTFCFVIKMASSGDLNGQLRRAVERVIIQAARRLLAIGADVNTRIDDDHVILVFTTTHKLEFK